MAVAGSCVGHQRGRGFARGRRGGPWDVRQALAVRVGWLRGVAFGFWRVHVPVLPGLPTNFMLLYCYTICLRMKGQKKHTFRLHFVSRHRHDYLYIHTYHFTKGPKKHFSFEFRPSTSP